MQRSSSVAEPEVFEALAVKDAVGLGNEAIDLRVIAVGGSRVEKDRSRVVVGQLLFDRPHHMLALRDIAYGRLLIDPLPRARADPASFHASCSSMRAW
jgi:hypothetical protein